MKNWILKKRNRPFWKPTPGAERGQIVVEYVLLLVVGVTVAILITSTMVSRNPDRPGFLIRKWMDILKLIGDDQTD